MAPVNVPKCATHTKERERMGGKERGHVRDQEKERKFPEYSWDYCFPGDEIGYKWTVLVGKESGSGAIMAKTGPVKGGGHRLTVGKMMEFLKENADQKGAIIVKSDQ